MNDFIQPVNYFLYSNIYSMTCEVHSNFEKIFPKKYAARSQFSLFSREMSSVLSAYFAEVKEEKFNEIVIQGRPAPPLAV